MVCHAIDWFWIFKFWIFKCLNPQPGQKMLIEPLAIASGEANLSVGIGL
jgi:hypothetical protein